MGYAAAVIILVVLLTCVAVLFVWCVVQWVIGRQQRDGGCVCSWHVCVCGGESETKCLGRVYHHS